MKINELLNEQEQLDELEPGQVPAWYDPRRLYGQGKQARQISKQDKQAASDLYKAWYGYAVRLERALQGNPNAASERPRYLKAFLSKVLRIPFNSPAISNIDTIVDPSGLNYGKASVQKAINTAVQQRALSMVTPPSGNPPPGPTPPGPTPPGPTPPGPTPPTGPRTPTMGMRITVNGKNYSYSSKGWRDGNTGAVVPAGSRLERGLNSYVSRMPSP